MSNIHLVLYIVATVFFILAGLKVTEKVRCEWLGAAALTLTLFV